MSIPKVIKLVDAPEDYDGLPPEEIAVIGGTGGGSSEPTAWGDVTGKPSTFPPATHTHTVADVTDLEDRLAAVEALEARIAALETAAGE